MGARGGAPPLTPLGDKNKWSAELGCPPLKKKIENFRWKWCILMHFLPRYLVISHNIFNLGELWYFGENFCQSGQEKESACLFDSQLKRQERERGKGIEIDTVIFSMAYGILRFQLISDIHVYKV